MVAAFPAEGSDVAAAILTEGSGMAVKEGALLLPTDPLLAVLHTNEEVLAEVCSWDRPPLPERYRKACQSLGVEENRRVSLLCEVSHGAAQCVRITANHLNNDLLPEIMSAAATLPRLRILDISANQITGEGCQVSGPLGDVCVDSLSDHIRDLRLCSQSLNKLDQDALQQSWRPRSEPDHLN
ncbi:tonsoku-like protein [Chanodichthys erythropterus]|uniref:tonsoku-like protein n=1 Tax=Chanodichthys erythropterus TaxID=933992 RepID=UPI00351E67C7